MILSNRRLARIFRNDWLKFRNLFCEVISCGNNDLLIYYFWQGSCWCQTSGWEWFILPQIFTPRPFTKVTSPLGSRAFSVWVRVPSGAPLSEQAISRLLRLLFSITARLCFGSSAPNHSLSPLRFDLKSRPLGGFFSYSPARRSERAATLRARIFHSPDRKP